MHKNYRIGLDVGTNSLGWSVLLLDQNGDPNAIEAAGVRIFTDGRNKKSKTLAADRRDARLARRRRDRFKQRQAFLVAALTKAELFPADKEEREALRALNPLELRARLLTEQPGEIVQGIIRQSGKTQKDEVGKILRKAVIENHPEYLIGRALFHLNQRRGFQSNRKDRSNISDGPVSKSLAATREKLREKNARTIGEFFWPLHKAGQQTRARPRRKSGQQANDPKQIDHYDYYLERDMLQDEFEKIWESQAKNHPNIMTDEHKQHIHQAIFTQRPLWAPKVGKCMYMPKEEYRGANALPSIQHHRIYQDLNNLSWKEKNEPVFLKGYPEAYEKIEQIFLYPAKQTGEIEFSSIREELKKMGVMKEIEGISTKDKKDKPVFNLEHRDDKYLNGDKTTAFFGGKKSPIKDMWNAWDITEQDRFVETIIRHVSDEKRMDSKGRPKERYQSDEEAIMALCKEYSLNKQDAEICVNFNLPSGYAKLSQKAARYITEEMKGGRKLTQRQAVQKIAKTKKVEGFKDPYEFTGTGEKNRLEYYGKVFKDTSHIIPGTEEDEDEWDDRKYWGGVSNPSVHIALNQIRRVVNELIDRFGKPEAISIELGRNLPLGPKNRQKIITKNRNNREHNERDKKELKAPPFNIFSPSAEDIKKLRLWKEAKKICPFCSNRIGCANLFNGAEREHLIPQAYGGDDNWGNLTIACQVCNRSKGGQTPYETFGDKPDYSALPEYKHWRFQEDAKDIWEKKYKGFLSRHINDTRYIGRIAKAYLGEICADNKNITVVTGQLTHHLRKHWNLDSILDDPKRPEEERGTKNRNDHRHHAVDAIVIGMITRGLVQKIARIKERNETLSMEKLMGYLIGDSKKQRENFLKEAEKIIDPIIVSHKPSRKKPVYEAYLKDENGEVELDDHGNPKKIVTSNRKEARLDKKGRPIKMSTDGQLLKETAYAIIKKDEIEKNKETYFSNAVKVRHQGRIEKKTVIPIKDKNGNIYKAYESADNWGMEIYEYPEKHEKAGKWEGVLITRFVANQPSFKPGHTRKPHPAARLVMRLQKRDLLEIDTDIGRQVMVVHEISGSKIVLAPSNEANTNARDGNKDVYGVYKGEAFAGKATGKGKDKKIIFKLSEKTETEINTSDPDLDWTYVDDFSYIRISINPLQKKKPRKVHISPTGKINYEIRHKP